MPKTVQEADFDAIVRAVAALPDGGSADEVARASPLDLSPRTLQRRLATLVARGRLRREGRGPGVRYYVRAADSSVQSRPAPVQIPIPITAEAAEVREAVQAPIQSRTPVGHNRAFLDDYHPGQTWHLPRSTRERLIELGTSPDRELAAGTYARSIYQRLLIDLSWNSSRLEGNTYSLLETERLLELGERAEGKDARDAQMILNHKAAVDLLVDQSEHLGFNRYTILNLHALLAENLLADSSAWGRLRSASVDIGGSVYHPPAIPQYIEECFDLVLAKAAAISDPLEQSFFALVHLPYLQPFLDVNKRVSRLAANLPFIRANLCPLSFIDVPARAYIDGLLGVYELNRIELLRDVFCWAYERSCARYSVLRQTLGAPTPLRQRHRALIARLIGEVVAGQLDKRAAGEHIRRGATELAEADRGSVVDVVEADLANLHIGNIARAKLSPAQFETWKAGWR